MPSEKPDEERLYRVRRVAAASLDDVAASAMQEGGGVEPFVFALPNRLVPKVSRAAFIPSSAWVNALTKFLSQHHIRLGAKRI